MNEGRRIAGWLCVALGFAVVVLLGWQFDVVALRSVLPGANSMKPLSAVAFLLAGLALLNRCSRQPVSGLGLLLSALVAGAGVLSLAGYVLGFPLASPTGFDFLWLVFVGTKSIWF